MMMISGADHHNLSVVRQTQACQLQIVGQQKSGPLHPVGGGEGAPTASPLSSSLCFRITLSKHVTDNLINIVSKVIIM